MKSDNIVLDKSFNFAVRIVKLYKYLRYTIDERVLSTQILKSGLKPHNTVSRNSYTKCNKKCIKCNIFVSI